MRLLARGYDMLKFFPAEASGGAPALKAIGAPLPQITFCPTGGVSPANAESLPDAAQRALRRRQLGRAERPGGGGRLGRDRSPCAGRSPSGSERMNDLAVTASVADKKDAMFAGAKINSTGCCAVLHTALSANDTAPLMVDGENVAPIITDTLSRMEAFARGVHSGYIDEAGGDRFSDMVNISIGGSDLGPAMATLAPAPYHTGPRCRFVSNVDRACEFNGWRQHFSLLTCLPRFPHP